MLYLLYVTHRLIRMSLNAICFKVVDFCKIFIQFSILDIAN